MGPELYLCCLFLQFGGFHRQVAPKKEYMEVILKYLCLVCLTIILLFYLTTIFTGYRLISPGTFEDFTPLTSKIQCAFSTAWPCSASVPFVPSSDSFYAHLCIVSPKRSRGGRCCCFPLVLSGSVCLGSGMLQFGGIHFRTIISSMTFFLISLFFLAVLLFAYWNSYIQIYFS